MKRLSSALGDSNKEINDLKEKVRKLEQANSLVIGKDLGAIDEETKESHVVFETQSRQSPMKDTAKQDDIHEEFKEEMRVPDTNSRADSFQTIEHTLGNNMHEFTKMNQSDIFGSIGKRNLAKADDHDDLTLQQKIIDALVKKTVADERNVHALNNELFEYKVKVTEMEE